MYTEKTAEGGVEKTDSIVADSDDGRVRTTVSSRTAVNGDSDTDVVTTIYNWGDRVEPELVDRAVVQNGHAVDRMTDRAGPMNRTFVIETGGSTSAVIDPDTMDRITSYGVDLTVNGADGSVHMDGDVCDGLTAADTEVRISMSFNAGVLTESQRKAVGDSQYVDLSLSEGGAAVHTLGGKATVVFGYEPAGGQDVSDICVYYVDPDGGKTKADSVYADGLITVTTDHFSVFMVGTETEPEPAAGGAAWMYAAAVLAILAAAAVCLYVRSRKDRA